MGRVVGVGFRVGNSCTPVVDSCQCMAKPVQCCKVKKKKKWTIKILESSFYIYTSFLVWTSFDFHYASHISRDAELPVTDALIFLFARSHQGSLVTVISRQHMRWLWDISGRKPFWIGKYLCYPEEEGKTTKRRSSFHRSNNCGLQ